jgi:hypothetical protein
VSCCYQRTATQLIADIPTLRLPSLVTIADLDFPRQQPPPRPLSPGTRSVAAGLAIHSFPSCPTSPRAPPTLPPLPVLVSETSLVRARQFDIAAAPSIVVGNSPGRHPVRTAKDSKDGRRGKDTRLGRPAPGPEQLCSAHRQPRGRELAACEAIDTSCIIRRVSRATACLRRPTNNLLRSSSPANAQFRSVWISLSSSVILFNKWILSTLDFGKNTSGLMIGRREERHDAETWQPTRSF